jgi:hypothetical protein
MRSVILSSMTSLSSVFGANKIIFALPDLTVLILYRADEDEVRRREREREEGRQTCFRPITKRSFFLALIGSFSFARCWRVDKVVNISFTVTFISSEANYRPGDGKLTKHDWLTKGRGTYRNRLRWSTVLGQLGNVCLIDCVDL